MWHRLGPLPSPRIARLAGDDEVDGSCDGIECHNVMVLNLTSGSHPNED
jgi:hypothetical protein